MSRPSRASRSVTPLRAPAPLAAAAVLVAAVLGFAALFAPPAQAATGPLQAESAALSGGVVVATDHSGFTGSGFVGGYTDANRGTAATTFTVSAQSAGQYRADLRYANGTTAGKILSLVVDGGAAVQVVLPATANWDSWSLASTTVSLSAGSHSLAYRYGTGDSGNVNLDSLTLTAPATTPTPTSTATASTTPTSAPTPTPSSGSTRGASVPYTEYEAEAGQTNAPVLGPDRTYLTVASEASGRRAVRLSQTGQYVKITLTRPANSVVVRYSIPDTADGAGQTAPLSLYAGSTRLPDLTATSIYSWVYGSYPYTNTPSQGSPHHFFDETHALIGSWPAGTVLTLQKDAGDTAAHYDIDLIDAEQAPGSGSRPAGSVSVTDYGATAGDGSDDSGAIDNAVRAASSSGSVLWFPAETFNITRRINVAGVTIRGAGQWYTTIRGANGKGGFFATGSNVTISDLLIAGDVRYRDDQNFDTGIEGNFGSGSSVSDVWIEHTKVGMWIDSGTRGLTVTRVRIRDTFADGVNIHADVQDTVVSQTVVRNTGDDGLAMFSQGSPVTRCRFEFDTVQLPLLANGIAIYGGTDNAATDDTVADTVTGSTGIAISTRFNPVPFAGTTTVARDTLTRTGGYEPNWGIQLPALWIYADTADITTPVRVTAVDIRDSTYQGVLLSYGRTITNLALDRVAIAGAGTYGIATDSVNGSATLAYVTVTGAANGGLSNPSGYTFTRGAGDSGF